MEYISIFPVEKKGATPLQLLFNAPIQLQAIDFISLHVFSFQFIHVLLFNSYFINPLFTGITLQYHGIESV